MIKDNTILKGVRMQLSLIQKIDQLAKEQNRTFSNMVNTILLNSIETKTVNCFKCKRELQAPYYFRGVAECEKCNVHVCEICELQNVEYPGDWCDKCLENPSWSKI